MFPADTILLWDPGGKVWQTAGDEAVSLFLREHPESLTQITVLFGISKVCGFWEVPGSCLLVSST